MGLTLLHAFPRARKYERKCAIIFMSELRVVLLEVLSSVFTFSHFLVFCSSCKIKTGLKKKNTNKEKPRNVTMFEELVCKCSTRRNACDYELFFFGIKIFSFLYCRFPYVCSFVVLKLQLQLYTNIIIF